MPSRGGQRALSIAELVMAIGLLALMLLSCIQLFTQLLASNGKNRGDLAAITFATHVLEAVVEGGSATTGSGVQAAYATDPNSAVQYYYEVTRQPLPHDNQPATGIYTGGYQLRVQVWWNSDSAAQLKPGVGLLSATVSRFVYTRETVP